MTQSNLLASMRTGDQTPSTYVINQAWQHVLVIEFRSGGSGEKLIQRVHWPASLAESLSPKVSGKPCLKYKLEGDQKRHRTSISICTCSHECVYTPCTIQHTYTHDMGES